MKKNNKSMIIVIIILLSLSIGFAAFTRNLNITFTDTNVRISGNLDVKILASNNPNDISTVINGFSDFNLNSVNPAIISSDRTVISGLGTTFTNKDQSIAYEFYIYNNSEYDAYLKSVDFLNYNYTNSNKVCTALEGTTQSLVDEACEDIHIWISVGEDLMIDTSTSGFTSVKIPKGEIVIAVIEIAYAGDKLNEIIFGTTGSALLPNGDFKINFGDIKFSFSSLEG